MNQIGCNHSSFGIQKGSRRPAAQRLQQFNGIEAASCCLVAISLLVSAVGCAPWSSSPRRLPAPELKAPTDSGTNARPTHLTSAKANELDLADVLGLEDATTPPLPKPNKFRFTNRESHLEPDPPSTTNTLSNSTAQALTPNNNAFAMQEPIVRIEPQILDEEILLIGFEQVVEQVPAVSDAIAPQVDTTTLPPSGLQPEINDGAPEAVVSPAADERETIAARYEESSGEQEIIEATAVMAVQDEPSERQVALIRQGAQACMHLALASHSADPAAPQSEQPHEAVDLNSTSPQMPNAQISQLIRDMMAGATQALEPPAHSPEQTEYRQLRDELVSLLNQQLSMMDGQQTAGLDPAERKYWRLQAQALINLLNASNESSASTVPRQAVIDAVECLRRTIKEMEATANLNIPKAEFCTEVRGFGQYDSLKENVVQTGQPLLIYCELENYISKPTTVGDEAWFATRLRSRLVVRDPLGRIVQRAEFPLVEDLARNQRNDFYIHIPFTVGELRSGSYRLDLVVEDIEGNKTACYQPGLTFRVR